MNQRLGMFLQQFSNISGKYRNELHTKTHFYYIIENIPESNNDTRIFINMRLTVGKYNYGGM